VSRKRRMTAHMARKPSRSRGAKRSTSASHSASSSQNWMLRPSRKGTNNPLVVGVQSKPRLGRLSFFDDQWMQESGEVSAWGHLHTGEGFFDGAGAANALARFEKPGRVYRHGEISCTGKTVVACADDDCIPLPRGEVFHRSGIPIRPRVLAAGVKLFTSVTLEDAPGQI